MNLTEASSARVIAVLLMIGCGTVAACHQPEPNSPDVGLTKAVDPPELPGPGRGASRAEIDVHYKIWIGDALAHTCSGPAPFFGFDASDPKKDQPTMQMLANCMIDGPLKGKTIRLIGHTDPRGTPGYNDKLGLERAESVKQYLVSHGVAIARVQTASVGEDDARQNPAVWSKDRRVEIKLVE